MKYLNGPVGRFASAEMAEKVNNILESVNTHLDMGLDFYILLC